MTETHLDPDLIAAYAERRLTPQEQAPVEAHLATCAECRREASAAALLVREERRRRGWLLSLPVVAVAAVLAMVVVLTPSTDRPGRGGTLRPGDEAQREGVRTLAAFAPAEGSVVPRVNLRFTWQRDGPDALYHFTLADRSGLPRWQITTGDTSLAVPDTLALSPGERYLWYVDVLLPDAQKATTGVREFTLGR
jgi:hypothetical protein